MGVLINLLIIYEWTTDSGRKSNGMEHVFWVMSDCVRITFNEPNIERLCMIFCYSGTMRILIG
jgi:hypothetical protein